MEIFYQLWLDYHYSDASSALEPTESDMEECVMANFADFMVAPLLPSFTDSFPSQSRLLLAHGLSFERTSC